MGWGTGPGRGGGYRMDEARSADSRTGPPAAGKDTRAQLNHPAAETGTVRINHASGKTQRQTQDTG